MRPITSMMSQWKAETKEGNNLQFELCKGGYFSDKEEYGLKVVGKIDQKTMTGKNLVQTVLNTSIVVHNTSITSDASGVICVKGTSTGSGGRLNYGMFFKKLMLSSGTYTLSVSNAVNFDICLSKDDTYEALYVLRSGGRYMCFTLLSDMKVLLGFNFETGGIYDSTFQIQLELGDTVTEYEPYCGGIPSPNPDYPQEIQCVKAGTKVAITGKNLSTIDTIEVKKGMYDIPISLPKSGAYVCDIRNMDHTFDGISRGSTYSCSFLDAEKNILCRYVHNGVMISDEVCSNISFLRVSVDTAYYGGTSDKFLIQLELGDTATEYEPYISGGELTVPCDLYEGDIWYPMTGKVEKKYYHRIIMGNENWMSNNSNTIWYISDNKTIGFINSQCVVLCTHFPFYRSSHLSIKYGYLPVRGFHRMYNLEPVFTNIDNFKQWLKEQYDKNKPVELLSVAKDDSIEQYDPQPIFAPQGTVNVIQIPTDLSADLSATMLVKRT